MLTIQELKKAEGSILYYERRRSLCIPVIVEISSKEYACFRIAWSGSPLHASFENYNIVWRCWKEKPTDEQRDSVKWEEG